MLAPMPTPQNPPTSRSPSSLFTRNSAAGIVALALLVGWYCLITPRLIAPGDRTPTYLLMVLAALFLSSLWISARRFESRTWKPYLRALLIGCTVTGIVFVAFMVIMLNTVGS